MWTKLHKYKCIKKISGGDIVKRWKEKFSGIDNVDGDMDMSQAVIGISGCYL